MQSAIFYYTRRSGISRAEEWCGEDNRWLWCEQFLAWVKPYSKMTASQQINTESVQNFTGECPEFYQNRENVGVFLLWSKGHSWPLWTLTSTAAARAASRFQRLGFRAVTGIEPAITFQVEACWWDHLFYGCPALRTLAGGRIRKFLAQFKVVITACTTVFVHRHSG